MNYLKSALLTLFLILLASTPHVFAQEPDPQGLAGQGPAFTCLDFEYCHESQNCSVPHGHRARLTTEKVAGASQSNAYITECFDNVDSDGDGPIPEKTICTTGSSELDKQLFCTEANRDNPECDHFAILQRVLGYSLNHDDTYGYYYFQNLASEKAKTPLTGYPTNQSSVLTTSGLGKIIPPIIEVQSYTPVEHLRKFMLFTTGDIESRGSYDAVGGLQQDKLTFEFRSESCLGRSWDPEGRVYDVDTLLPLQSGTLEVQEHDPALGPRTILENFTTAMTNSNNFFLGSNPTQIGANGYFQYFLTAGYYYRLKYTNPNYRQLTQAEANTIPANARKIYFDPKTNALSSSFVDSPGFLQKEVLLHKDVPVKATGTPQQYVLTPPKAEFSGLQNDGVTVRYAGVINYPFAKMTVSACSMVNGAEECRNPKVFTKALGGPDEFGNYDVKLKQTDLENGEYYKAEFEAVDLTTATLSSASKKLQNVVAWLMSLVVGDVSAQTAQKVSSDPIYPIPSYIEGYAYSAEGDLLPGAKVGIYVDVLDQPTYYTTADANGFFRITSEYLPFDSYVIKYTPADAPEKMSTVSTAQFLYQNKDFIEQEKIKAYTTVTSTTNPRRNVTPTYVPMPKISQLPNEFPELEAKEMMKQEDTMAPEVTTSTQRNPMYLVGAVLLILLGGVGVMLAIYVYKKRSHEDTSPQDVT